MKSTISHFSSFWMRVLPVMLVLFGLGFTKIQAQNYKPFDDAVISVNNALNDLRANSSVKAAAPKVTNGNNGSAKTSALSTAQSTNIQLSVFEITYFQLFLEKAKISHDIAQAVIDLDTNINPTQPVGRQTQTTTARANLMALITN